MGLRAESAADAGGTPARLGQHHVEGVGVGWVSARKETGLEMDERAMG